MIVAKKTSLMALLALVVLPAMAYGMHIAKRFWDESPWTGPFVVIMSADMSWPLTGGFVCDGHPLVVRTDASQKCASTLMFGLISSVAHMITGENWQVMTNAAEDRSNVNIGNGLVLSTSEAHPWDTSARRLSKQHEGITFKTSGHVQYNTGLANEERVAGINQAQGDEFGQDDASHPFVAFETSMGQHLAYGTRETKLENMYNDILNMYEDMQYKVTRTKDDFVERCRICPKSCINGEPFTIFCDGQTSNFKPLVEISWISMTFDWSNKDLAYAIRDSGAGPESCSNAVGFMSSNPLTKFCVTPKIRKGYTGPQDADLGSMPVDNVFRGELYINSYGGLDGNCLSPQGVA